MDQNCENCKFYNVLHDIKEWQDGECRRYAPRHISGVGTGYEEKLFPEVKVHDWCGEWKEEE